MEKWKVGDDAVAWTADDGDWVPADVAQGLYDALNWIADNYPNDDPAVINQTARAALAAADGEDV